MNNQQPNQPPQNPGGFNHPPLNAGGFNQPPNQNPGGFNHPPPNAGGFNQQPNQNPGGFNHPPPNAGGFHGGRNVNPHWLGPQSAYYVNLNDHKQRKQVLQGVKRRIINATGGAQKYEGSPVQASSTTLTAKNHPVIFQNAVMDASNKESIGGASYPLLVEGVHHRVLEKHRVVLGGQSGLFLHA